MIFFSVIILLILTSVVDCNCPIAKNAFDTGQKICSREARYNKRLYKSGFILPPSEPGAELFAEVPIGPSLKSDMKKAECWTYVKRMLREKELKDLQDTKNLKQFRKIPERFEEKFGLCYAKQVRCPNKVTVEECDKKQKYRSIGGICNNLDEPRMGAVDTQYGRILSADYADGISEPRRAFISQANLISPRRIGNLIREQERKIRKPENRKLFPFLKTYNGMRPKFQPKKPQIMNFGGLMFGQIITHDTGSRYTFQVAGKNGSGMACCSKGNVNALSQALLNSNCMPIDVPINDSFYKQFNQTCLHFVRAIPALPNDCKLGPNELINGVSAFLDLTVLYGDSVARLTSLRTGEKGLMKINKANVLPEAPCGDDVCYILGDDRLNQTPMLAIWHSYWLLVHNWCANSLSKLNPKWNDDKVFNECREITIAIYQHIIYDEWLPIVLGENFCIEQGLKCKQSNNRCGNYNSTVDAKTLNEYAHSVFRVLHKNVPDKVRLYKSDYSIAETILLSDTINNPRILNKQFLDLMRGQLRDPVLWENLVFKKELRNKLFKVNNTGVDLLSVDVFRERDVGVPPYYAYVEYCEGFDVRSWSDLGPYFTPDILNLLQRIYESVFDVDLFTGTLLEKKEETVFYGRVGRCVIAEQFQRFKFGDRFFYSFVLPKSKLREVNEVTISDLFCQVTKINEVPGEGFHTYDSSQNPYVKCSKAKQFNFSLWKDS